MTAANTVPNKLFFLLIFSISFSFLPAKTMRPPRIRGIVKPFANTKTAMIVPIKKIDAQGECSESTTIDESKSK